MHSTSWITECTSLDMCSISCTQDIVWMFFVLNLKRTHPSWCLFIVLQALAAIGTDGSHAHWHTQTIANYMIHSNLVSPCSIEQHLVCWCSSSSSSRIHAHTHTGTHWWQQFGIRIWVWVRWVAHVRVHVCVCVTVTVCVHISVCLFGCASDQPIDRPTVRAC